MEKFFNPMISIVLPCYNERDNITLLVTDIADVLASRTFEIIVVDDNSPDGTYDVLQSLNYPYLRPLLRKENPGFAYSIRAGIEASRGEIIIVMDSDFNHQPSYLPILIENCKFYEMVSGSRFVYGGSMGSRYRHICSWFFNIFIRVLTRKYVTDSLFGYFAVHRYVLEKIDYDSVFWGYGDYCIRLMYYLQKQKCNILQIPVVLGQRKHGEGNKNLVKTFCKYFNATIQLVFFPKKGSSECPKQ